MTKSDHYNPKKKTKSDPNPWSDIYSPCKLVCSIYGLKDGCWQDRNDSIFIVFADENFPRLFGREIPHGGSIPFDSIVRLCSNLSFSTVNRLKEAMRAGESTTEYLNLFRLDGVALSSHISLVSITGKKIISVVKPDVDYPALPTPSCANTVETTQPSLFSPSSTQHCFAVFTIRSSSVVGNSRTFGMGMFPLERVLPEAKQLTVETVCNSKSPNNSTNSQHSKRKLSKDHN